MFEKFTSAMFILVYTAAGIVIALDVFYWRPF